MHMHKALLVVLLQYPFSLVQGMLNPGPGTETRRENAQVMVGQAGEAHGSPFSDFSTPSNTKHFRPDTINLWGCGPGEHFSKFEIIYRDNLESRSGKPTVAHGSETGSSKKVSLTLAADDYISKITLTTWQKKVYKNAFFWTKRTRVGSIVIDTIKKGKLACGAGADTDTPTPIWKADHAFIYFDGSAGDGLDQLSAWFIPVSDY